ncbi:hypothetical protein TNCV_3017491 [Trichonephila clavipes]|nr:hypothetical protein TNCV_3017491 [Trichonephila clavipes]
MVTTSPELAPDFQTSMSLEREDLASKHLTFIKPSASLSDSGLQLTTRVRTRKKHDVATMTTLLWIQVSES